MAVSQKDAEHLQALVEMAAKGHVITSTDVSRDDTANREKELFEAYQRGKRDAFAQAKNAIQSMYQEGR